MNIAQTNLMRFIRVHIFNKKYLLLSCVVYRLTSVFLIQAIRELLSSCSQMFFKRTFRSFIKKELQHRCSRVFKQERKRKLQMASNKKEKASRRNIKELRRSRLRASIKSFTVAVLIRCSENSKKIPEKCLW